MTFLRAASAASELLSHARACRGHPRLPCFSSNSKTWVAGREGVYARLRRAMPGHDSSVDSERRNRGVERGARPHRGRRFGIIGQVVTADVDALALRADQLAIDLGFV